MNFQDMTAVSRITRTAAKNSKKKPTFDLNCTLSSRQYKKIKLGNGLSSIFYRAKAIKF
ncbi:hypothetical protein J2Y67_005289, partial [Neobacillus niacini]|nr:hypothetical protein [Neobacillus niacini]